MLSRTQGVMDATWDEMWGDKEGSGWSSELGVRKPDSGPDSATHSNFDMGQVNFSSLGFSFPMSELRERDKNQGFKHSGNLRGQVGYLNE